MLTDFNLTYCGNHFAIYKNTESDFPGGPVVKTPHFHCRGAGSIPGRGAKVPHTVWRNQKTN